MDSCKASNIELINKKFGSNIDRHMKKHSPKKMKLVASSNENQNQISENLCERSQKTIFQRQKGL